jgi:hypothetical protein
MVKGCGEFSSLFEDHEAHLINNYAVYSGFWCVANDVQGRGFGNEYLFSER